MSVSGISTTTQLLSQRTHYPALYWLRTAQYRPQETSATGPTVSDQDNSEDPTALNYPQLSGISPVLQIVGIVLDFSPLMYVEQYL